MWKTNKNCDILNKNCNNLEYIDTLIHKNGLKCKITTNDCDLFLNTNSMFLDVIE